MELEINYSLKDYIQANRIHLKSNKRIYYIISFGLVFLLFSIFLIIVEPKGIFPWFALIYSIIMFTYPISVIPISSKFYMKKQKYFDGPVKLKFVDNTIFSDSQIGESKIKWITKIIIREGLLLIYTTPKNFIIVNEKYCTGKDQFELIGRFVKNMPGSGNVDESEGLKSNYGFLSFLIAIINLLIFIFTVSSLTQFGSDAKLIIKLMAILWIFSILSALVGIYFGIKSILKKNKLVLSSIGILLNLLIAFLIGLGLYPD